MSDVRLRGISKTYPGTARPAVEALDLTIPSGELAVLVGPSGCGKSTTLRIVAGLEQPTCGKVFIDERDVTELPPSDRDIAMVFQSYALYPHMTVFDNLAFALRIRKLDESEIRSKVDATARSLGIEGYLDRKPKNLSGGQRQRVAIGRAVIREPKVFLFDEPLSNLDAKLRGEMRREIARIHQRSKTTSLYVTHDQVEAMTLADRIVVLRDGEVQQVGGPSEIYDRPANRFVAGFFGTPTMNFLSAKVHDEPGGASARGRGFELPLPSSRRPEARELILGIRPEAVTLEQRPSASPLAGNVDHREVLGSEVLLYLSTDAGQVTVRADAGSEAREGQSITVWLAADRLHMFDARSELRL